jgi:hypothetical protein
MVCRDHPGSCWKVSSHKSGVMGPRPLACTCLCVVGACWRVPRKVHEEFREEELRSFLRDAPFPLENLRPGGVRSHLGGENTSTFSFPLNASCLPRETVSIQDGELCSLGDFT